MSEAKPFEKEYRDVLRKMIKLAFGRTNDIAKLISEPEGLSAGEIDSLNLSQIAEIRRGANGVLEIKLIDRLKLIEKLLEVLEPGDDDGAFWQGFFGQAGREAEGDEAF